MKAKTFRKYFYHVDLQGQLFLESTRHRTIASCFKDPAFLTFFFQNLRPNKGEYDEFLDPQTPNSKTKYGWISRCGAKEINYVDAVRTGIVYQDLVPSDSSSLVFLNKDMKKAPFYFTMPGGKAVVPFDGSGLALDDEGMVFYDAPAWLTGKEDGRENIGEKYCLVKSSLVMNLFGGMNYHSSQDAKKVKPVVDDNGPLLMDENGYEFLGKYHAFVKR
jgi:hypothetical protein